MDIVIVILTSLLSVIALFLITKLMGHKQLSQMDFFDYICGITFGSIAAELATELETPQRPLVAMAVYGAVSVLLSFVTHKLPRARKYINGTPTILMNNGKIYRENMKKAKLDLTEFMLLCREQGYFSLSDIHTAVFESNGKLSILPLAAKRPATPADLGLQPSAAHIETEIILDGRILGENLKRMGREDAWLTKALREQGFTSARQVFLGLCDEEGRVTLYGRE